MGKILLSSLIMFTSITWSYPQRSIAAQSERQVLEIKMKKSYYERQLKEKQEELKTVLWKKQFLSEYGSNKGYTLFVNNADNVYLGTALGALAGALGSVIILGDTTSIKNFRSGFSNPWYRFYIVTYTALGVIFGAVIQLPVAYSDTVKFRDRVNSMNEDQLQNLAEQLQDDIDSLSQEIIELNNKREALATKS